MEKVIDSEKIKIGIIETADYTKGKMYGGITGFIKCILPHFSSQEVIVFGLGINGTTPWKTTNISKNLKFIPISNFKFPSRIPMRLKALYAYTRSRRKIMKLNFDVLYIHSPEICLPFLFFNKYSPVIYHQHGFSNALHSSKFSFGEAQIFRKFFDFAMWIIYKKASWIIAIDPIGIQQAKSAGAGKKTSLLLNAVDTQRFSFDKRIRNITRKKLGLSEKVFVIFNAGRIEKQKGIQRLLDCIPLLKKKDLQFHIFIAGDGSYKTKLKEIVKNSKYDHLVTFLGRIDHEFLPKYYNMADVFLLPSEKEGVPMAILESIACGTPVIANRVGGIPEFLHDGINGMLLNDLSPTTITTTILHVYKSKFDRKVVAHTVDKLSSQNAITSLLNIVHRIAVK